MLAVLAPALLAGPPHLAGAQSDVASQVPIEVASVDASSYPNMSAVVYGPAVAGGPDDAFDVVEDGEAVTADVVRLRSDDLNVIVVVDESGSMRGEPIERAQNAVIRLAETLPAGAEVGLVGFGDEARTLTPLTEDRSEVVEAVGALAPAGETSLFDGIALGLDRLDEAGGIGSLIVLTDGADTSSTISIDDVSARLAADEAPSFSIVTLQTEDFDGEVARQLADAAGGQVVGVTDANQLVSAFEEIASGLGGQYAVRWVSNSTDGDADLSIALAGRPDTAVTSTFSHPSVRFEPDLATDPVALDPGPAVLGSSWVPIAGAAAVCFGAALVLFLLRSQESATDRRAKRKAEKQASAAQRTVVAGLADKLTSMSTNALDSSGRRRRIDDTLDAAGLAIRSGELVAFLGASSVAAAGFGYVLVGLPLAPLFALIPLLGTFLGLKFKVMRRRSKFVNQLGSMLQLLTGSLTAGYGLGQALDAVAKESESPTAEELRRVVMETRLGRPLQDALGEMSARMQSPDFDWVVDAIKIQVKVGGNLSEIIDQVGDTIRARNRVRRQVNALTAEGKISALVLFALPFGLVGFISVSNPSYVAPLFGTTPGYMLLGAAGTLMTVGGLWLRKLVQPDF